MLALTVAGLAALTWHQRRGSAPLSTLPLPRNPALDVPAQSSNVSRFCRPDDSSRRDKSAGRQAILYTRQEAFCNNRLAGLTRLLVTARQS